MPIKLHHISIFATAILLLWPLGAIALDAEMDAEMDVETPGFLPLQSQTVLDIMAEVVRLYQEGTEQLHQGKLEQALETFGRILEMLGETGISEEPRSQEFLQAKGATLNQIGFVYRNLGQHQKALEFFEKALTIFEAIASPQSVATTLSNIGAVRKNISQYPQALDSYREALAIFQDLNDRLGIAATTNNMAATYHNLGQMPKALELYEQALAIFEEIGDERGRGTLLNNIGLVTDQLGRDTEALQFYEEALSIFEAEEYLLEMGMTLAGIGLLQNNQGEYFAALQSLERSLLIRRQVGDRPGEGVTLDYMGRAYSNLGWHRKALSCYKQALAIFREVGDKTEEGIVLHNIGATHLKRRRLLKATDNLMAAVEIWESLRPGLTDQNKVSLFETQAETYRYLQEASIAQNKITAALEIAERGRARAFVELLASRLASESTKPTYSPPQAIVWQEIQQIAATHSATLVEYSIVGEQLYIWVVRPTGEIAFRSVNLSPLEMSIKEVVERSRVAAATGRMRGSETQANQTQSPDLSVAEGTNVSIRKKNPRLVKTYQLLIDPIADLLPPNEGDRVIFIPHRELFLVPFAALQDEGGSYLIEKYSILTAPSIQVLSLTQQHRVRRELATNKNVLVVGNPTMPTMPGLTLAPLPGAEREALAIARTFDTRAKIGAEATESSVVREMATARIIHLATHGLLDELKNFGFPVPGAIALAPSRTKPFARRTNATSAATKKDGFLTSDEIIDLKLNAELVVLSACNTGRGRITGDGVVGLSRSFMAAGVESVVVSLWLVPDSPTADLMTEFYRQLLLDPDKARALRQAMLATMQKYPEPRDWAAFTLIGEAE